MLGHKPVEESDIMDILGKPSTFVEKPEQSQNTRVTCKWRECESCHKLIPAEAHICSNCHKFLWVS
jgi:hypothetical protein